MQVRIGDVIIGGDELALIAGPCVIESEELCLEVASFLKEKCARLGIGYVFKSSYDKANRTSISSFRGPGLEKGLEILRNVREKVGVPVLTDVHSPEEAKIAGEIVDALQIPAFLCRQTDLLLSAGRTGKPVNVKKGQFLAPWDMRYVVEKIESTGNRQILLCERGTSFGYNNLVVDFRGLVIMRKLGYPIVFDATHSVQMPGAGQGMSGGDRELAPHLLRAACAVGIDAIFLETHPQPEKGLSDPATMLPLYELPSILEIAVKIFKLVRKIEE
ncbi:3-deoxy-8-phosphooctulonate synthase [bacterium]|nr:3-deoxy-8-phosphooctulonate synthase [bacterium]